MSFVSGVQGAERRYTRHLVILGAGRESIGHAAVDRGTGTPAFADFGAEVDREAQGLVLVNP